MTDVNFELVKLQTAAATRRDELQAEVKKVVYGTFLLGVAVAMFPVVSAWIEHRFNLRIEEVKQVNQLKLQENQLKLDLQKLVEEVEAAKTKASFEATQSDRKFFEDISDETRSANLSDRITIAEFFTFLAGSDEERSHWKLFRDRLLELQNQFNQDRTRLVAVIASPRSTDAGIQEAAAKLSQIMERESGVGVTVRTPWAKQIPLSSFDFTGDKPWHAPSNGDLLEMLGAPGQTFGQECDKITNPDLARLMVSGSVGPFDTTLLAPAHQSLVRIFERLKSENPNLYDEVGLAGGLCVRLVRGSSTQLSNHSWGTAIDITIGREPDVRGDGMVQVGLVELAHYFADEGWVWGGGFSTEDPMHFEVSAEKLREWAGAGLFAAPAGTVLPPAPAGTVLPTAPVPVE